MTVEWTFFSSAHTGDTYSEMFWAVKQISTYLKEFKLYKVCSLTQGTKSEISIRNICRKSPNV